MKFSYSFKGINIIMFLSSKIKTYSNLDSDLVWQILLIPLQGG